MSDALITYTIMNIQFIVASNLHDTVQIFMKAFGRSLLINKIIMN